MGIIFHFIVFLAAGFLILKSADFLKVPPAVIGLSMIALGTSLPELLPLLFPAANNIAK